MRIDFQDKFCAKLRLTYMGIKLLIDSPREIVPSRLIKKPIIAFPFDFQICISNIVRRSISILEAGNRLQMSQRYTKRVHLLSSSMEFSDITRGDSEVLKRRFIQFKYTNPHVEIAPSRSMRFATIEMNVNNQCNAYTINLTA